MQQRVGTVLQPALASLLAGVAAITVAQTTRAQSPTINARTLMHMRDPAGPASSAIPSVPGVRLITAARYGDGEVLVGLSDRMCFLANGQSVRAVMQPGTPTPGFQRYWYGQFEAEIWPLPNGMKSFMVSTTVTPQGGPGQLWLTGTVDQPMALRTGLEAAPPCTATGLTIGPSSNSMLAVGPVGGTLLPIIPRNFQPPGGSGSSWLTVEPLLNNAGVAGISLNAQTPSGPRVYALVADRQAIDVRAISRQSLQTDRGTVRLATDDFQVMSQPTHDRSVFISTFATIGSTRWITFLATATPPHKIVAAAGDRAPGTEPGVVFLPTTPAKVITTNRDGSMVLLATLGGPGVTPDNDTALYLWRNARLTLIARSQGSPVYSPQRAGSITITSRGDVGIINDHYAAIHKPGHGTFVVARRGEPINPSSGLRGDIRAMYTFFGSAMVGSYDSGHDDMSIPSMSEDGRLLVLGYANAHFAVEFEVESTGCPSDFNLDGFTDFFDYLDFVTCFEGGRCPDGKPADFNDDGIADFFDYMEFVDAFEAAC